MWWYRDMLCNYILMMFMDLCHLDPFALWQLKVRRSPDLRPHSETAARPNSFPMLRPRYPLQVDLDVVFVHAIPERASSQTVRLLKGADKAPRNCLFQS